MSLRRIIALNNHGVTSLYHGRFNDAILSFHHAMQCAKEADIVNQAQDCAKTIPQNLPQCAVDLLDHAALMVVSPHNMFDIYQNAFFLSKETAVDMDKQEISLVLFYNLALAHHLAGIAIPQDSRAQLDQAMHFYKYCLNIAKSRQESSVDLITLILGCLTNMGHVFSHF